MSLKTLHLVVCFLFDYDVAVTEVGDNFEGQNDVLNATISRDLTGSRRSRSRYFN